MPQSIKPKMTSKIVNFDLESDRMTTARLARLPAPIPLAYEKSQLLLAKKLKTYFDNVDDSLFEMADKAHSNQEQNLFFDSMREIRVQRRGIEKRFSQGLDEAFADLIEPSSKRGAGQSFSSDALSLVDNDDLEEMVALDSSIAKANSMYGESIQYISLRMDSLLPIKVYQKNNPIGPEVLCDIFMAQVKRLDVEIKAKLVLFKLFDRLVISKLGDMYESINELFIENNILPSLSNASVHKRPRRRDESESQLTSTQASVHSPNQPTLTTGQPFDVAVEGGSQLSPEVLSALQQLFGGATPAPVDSSPLLNLLSHAQRVRPQNINTPQGESIDIKSLIAQVQAGSGKSAQIARADEEVINLVSMLFDFILDDKSLASAMKNLLARLQIPITKVALIDKTFFTKNGHSARRLLNEMSKAALGWQPNATATKEDPLFAKMKSVVKTLLSDFDVNVDLFSELLVDFTSFLEKEKRRSNVLEKRTLDAEDGKAKAEVARSTVALEVELRTINYPLPEAVQSLINQVWNNYLFVTALKHGYQSEAWRTGLKTLEDLVWSVNPPKNDDQRKGLIRLVPNLLKRLRVGFDAISYNPYDMSTLFKSLEDVHLKCIRGKAVDRHFVHVDGQGQLILAPKQNKATVVPVTKEAVQPKVSPKPVTPSVQQEPSAPEPASVNTIAEQEPSGLAAQLEQVDNFAQGDWFEMVIDNKAITRCRLAAYIKPTGKYIFINRNGMKVAERTKEELAQAIKNNQLRALDTGVLFDRALETVVSGMRKKGR